MPGNHEKMYVDVVFGSDTAQAEAGIKRLQASLSQLQTKGAKNILGEEFGKDLTDATIQLSKFQGVLKNSFNADTNKLDLTKFNANLQAAGMTAKDISKTFAAFGTDGKKAFSDLTNTIMDAEIPLKKNNKLVEKFAETLKNTARWMIASNLLTSVLGTFQHAFSYAQDLNRSLNDIRIVTSKSKDEMEAFAIQANKAAKTLSATTTEYTKASLIYFQQGLSDAEVKRRTDATVKMANVTGESVQQMSDELTSVWNNFMEAGDTNYEHYLDIMTKLGAETASSSEEISQGLQKFSGIAKTVGLSFEVASAALTTITDRTRQSADVVGTSLKTIFSRIEGLKLGETLEDGTDLNKYSEALATVGVQIKDEAGNLKDADEIIMDLGHKWKTLARDQQMALAQTVGGVRQYNQIMSLMSNFDFFEENLERARTASGTLDEQAEIYAESWDAAKKRISAAAEEIYDKLINDDFFIKLTDTGADLLGIISNGIDMLGGVPGLLTTIIALTTTLLNRSGVLSKTLQSTFAPSFAKQQQTGQAVQKSFLDESLALTKNGEISNEDTAINNALKARYGIQDTLLKNSKSMTDLELAQAKAIQDQYNALLEISIQKAKNLDLAQKEFDTVKKEVKERQALINNAYDVAAQTRGKKDSQKGTYTWISDKKGTFNKEGYSRSFSHSKDATISSTRTIMQSIGEDLSLEDEGTLRSITNFNNLSKEQEKVLLKVEAAIKRVTDAKSYQNKEGIKSLETIEQENKHYDDLITKLLRYKEEKNEKTSLDDIKGLLGEDEFNKLKLNTADIDKIIQKYDELKGKNIEVAKEEVRRLTQSGELSEELAKVLDKLGITYRENADISDLATTATEQFGQAIVKLKTNIHSWADALSGALQGMSQVTMSLTMLKGVWDTLQNPDIGPLEKITSITMTLGMALGSLVSGLKALSAAKVKDTTVNMLNAASEAAVAKAKRDTANASQQAALAQKVETTEQNKDNIVNGGSSLFKSLGKALKLRSKSGQAAMQDVLKSVKVGDTVEGTIVTEENIGSIAAKNGIANGSVLSGLASAAGPILGVVAALAAIAAAIYAVWKSFQKTEEALKDANEDLENATKATESAKEAYDSLNSSIDQIKSKRDAFTNLTKGTLEYKQALMESNQAVLDLINSNQDLNMSMLHGTAETGYYLYNRDIEQAQNAALERATRAMAVQMAAQQRASEAQNAQMIDDFLSSNGRWAKTKEGTTALSTINPTGDAISDLGQSIGHALVAANTDTEVAAMNSLGNNLLQAESAQEQMNLALEALGLQNAKLNDTEKEQILAIIENTKALNGKAKFDTAASVGEAFFGEQLKAAGYKGSEYELAKNVLGQAIMDRREEYEKSPGKIILESDLIDLIVNKGYLDSQYGKDVIQFVEKQKDGTYTLRGQDSRIIEKDLTFEGLKYMMSWDMAAQDLLTGSILNHSATNAGKGYGIDLEEILWTDLLNNAGLKKGTSDYKDDALDFQNYVIENYKVGDLSAEAREALVKVSNDIATQALPESFNELKKSQIASLKSFYESVIGTLKDGFGEDEYKEILDLMAAWFAQKADSTAASASDGWSKDKKYLSDVQKRYHDINNTLQLMQNNYKRISTLAEHAFGKTRIAYLKAAQKQLQESNKADEHKLELMKQQAEIDKQALADQNGRFNEYGQLTNYRELTAQWVDEYNSTVGEHKEEAGEIYEERMKFLENYENSQQELQEQQQKVLENYYAEKQAALDIIKYNVEFHVELAENSLKLIDYQLSKIQDNAFDGAKKIELLGDKMTEMASTNEEYVKALKETLGLTDEEIEKIKNGDMSVLDNKEYTAEEIQYVEELMDKLLQNSQDFKAIYKEIQEVVIASFDAITESIDTDISLLDEYSKALNNLDNIIDLAGKANNKNYSSLKVMAAEALEDNTAINTQAEIDKSFALQEKLRFLQNERKTADKNDQEALDKQIAETELAIEKQNSAITESYVEQAKAAENTYKAIVESAKKSYDEIMSGAFESIDEMDTYLKRYSEQRGVYLEAYEKEYELNKLLRNIDKQLSDSSQLKSNQRLLDLKQKISDAASSTAEMSKVELEMLQKQYDVEVARLALEETRNAKDRVTLVQGSEGNMYYAYSADLDKVDQATQNYEDALKAQKDSIFQWTEKLNSSLMSLIKIVNDNSGKYSKTYKEWAQKEINNLLRQRGDLSKALGSLNPQDAAQLGFSNSVLGQMFPDESFESLAAKWQMNFNTMSDTVNKAADEWEDKTNNIFEKMGLSVEHFEKDVTKAIQDIDEKHDALIKKMEEKYGENGTLTKKVRQTVEAFEEWKKKWLGENQDGPMYTMLKGNEILVDQADKIIKAIGTREGKDGIAGAFVEWKNAIHDVVEELGNITKKFKDITDGLAKLGKKNTITLIDAKTEAVLGEVEVDENGHIDFKEVEKIYKQKTKEKNPNLRLTDENGYMVRYPSKTTFTPGDTYSVSNINSTNTSTTSTKDQDNKRQYTQTVQKAKKYIVIPEEGEDPQNPGFYRVYTVKDNKIIDANSNNKRWIKGILFMDGNKFIKKNGFVDYDTKDYAYYVVPGTMLWANFDIKKFDTGGYTGEWGHEGKLAVLHQKELVLNADDTKRMLLMTQIARSVAQQVDLTAKYGLSTAGLVPYRTGSSTTANNMEQTVTIHAEFPGVTDSVEIKQALDNLMNTASHYANRK